MRTIPESIQTLLKSRSMIGVNKPAYEITIEGLGGSYDWGSLGTAWRTPVSSITDGGVTVEKKTSGALIVCGIVSGVIYQGTVADVATLLGADSTVTGWTSTGITVVGSARCHLFRADGILWMSVSASGSASVASSYKLYKSASGNGGDWALFSTVCTGLTNNELTVGGDDATAGSITVLDSGRYVLCGPYWSDFGGYGVQYPSIWTSDDDGTTWTKRYQGYYGVAAHSYFSYCASSEIALTADGSLYWGYGVDYQSTGCVDLMSTDNGVTWSDAPASMLTSDFTGGSFHVDGGGNLFYLSEHYGNGASDTIKIYQITDPGTTGSIALVKTTPAAAANGYTHAVIIGNNVLIVSGTHVLGMEVESSSLPVKSINISRNKNMAAQCDFTVINKDGEFSPDGTSHYHALWPNKTVTVKMGYGTEMVTVFTGLIDRIAMNTFPQEIQVSCRDNMKLLIDQIITSGSYHVLTYTNAEVSTIVADLFSKAGVTGTVETTTLTLPEKTFSWCSYADAISELCDLTGFEFGCDELGAAYFRKDTMTTTTADWTFSEGDDIVSLGYTIDDNDLYYKVAVYGEGHFAATDYGSRTYYNVLAQKFMKIDAPECNTAALCQIVSDRTVGLMESRCRVCDFSAVGVPWLQIGDLIQVTETSTTISEVYRITDMSLSMDGSGFLMSITCYHHSV